LISKCNNLNCFTIPQVLETVFSSAAKERKRAAESGGEKFDESATDESKSVSALAASSLVFDDADYGLHRMHHAEVDTTLLVYFFGRRGDTQLRSVPEMTS
jgi:hypothetical protein